MSFCQRKRHGCEFGHQTARRYNKQQPPRMASDTETIELPPTQSRRPRIFSYQQDIRQCCFRCSCVSLFGFYFCSLQLLHFRWLALLLVVYPTAGGATANPAMLAGCLPLAACLVLSVSCMLPGQRCLPNAFAAAAPCCCFPGVWCVSWCGRF